MNIQKTLLASVIAIACAGAVNIPAVQAEDYGRAATAYQALSSAETETLAFMREEEKLARDVYITLYRKWNLAIFSNISKSEQKHMDQIKMLLDRYSVVDPVVDKRVGVFSNAQLASLYEQLVRQGKKSMMDALYVGAFIEETDIADLKRAIDGTVHPDIAQVYSNLMKGSRNHLRAFVGQIENQGDTYEAQALTQDEVDAIVNSPRERGNINGRRGRR